MTNDGLRMTNKKKRRDRDSFLVSVGEQKSSKAQRFKESGTGILPVHLRVRKTRMPDPETGRTDILVCSSLSDRNV